ncbi:hypothetical protein ACFXPI_11115 [Streptomyces sp. NPDC059104]|uniref:hypothetical protein n=1 Tax=Streptomyces sp. NPDC059104 TaxID=3346729 RepID=UPI00367F3903
MSGWAWAGLGLTVWLLLGTALGLLLGRAIRRNTQNPPRPTNGPHAASWGRHNSHRRHRR